MLEFEKSIPIEQATIFLINIRFSWSVNGGNSDKFLFVSVKDNDQNDFCC